MLTDITKSQPDSLEDQPLPCNQWITCTPSQVYSLIWTALAESSPGRNPGLVYRVYESARQSTGPQFPREGRCFLTRAYSQSSVPRTSVLGYSQPSLTGLS